MKKLFTAFLPATLGMMFLLAGCTESILDDPDERFPDGFPIHVKTSDYNAENTYYILNDNEPKEVFCNASERSFYVDQPLQITVDDDLCFQLRFYSPRALPDVNLWVKIEGYDEQFKLFVFDKIEPFQQFRMQLPFTTKDMMAVTRSGKSIRIMANPHLSPSDLSFEIECDAPYYKTLQQIKCHWYVRFVSWTSGYWQPLRVFEAREAVAIALNMSYMYSTEEFATALKEFGPLHSNANKTEINKDALLSKVLKFSGFDFGRVSGVNGLGGGRTYGLANWCYIEHYADDSTETHTLFHEFGHCLGYGHDGNMTYENTGAGWQTLCRRVYIQMCIDKKMPVYSRRFLHTRRDHHPYRASKNIIEDPELDEIDGGLGAGGVGFLSTDRGEKEGAAALSFKLDYVGAETGEKNFMPSGVYVYGDKMYVTNDIRPANLSWDVYDLSSGKPVLEKRITKWINPDGTEQALGTPVDILRSNGKIYLAGNNNALFVFDAETYECTDKLALGYNAVGLAATNGVVYAYRGNVKAFPEHSFAKGAIATSASIESYSTNALTADYDGNIYAVASYLKKIVRIDPKYLKANQLLKGEELTCEAMPLGAAWSADGRLFVSFDGKQTQQKFCEVDPKTGAIIKDYTTIGDITLQNPAKCLIRRNTLFVVDRVNALCIYAIPLTQLD